MKKAFTLVELLVIMAIMVILLSITFPMFSSFKRSMDYKKFEGASMELLEDMRYAKVRALTNGEVQMTFAEDGYYLTDTFERYTYKKVSFSDGISIDFINSTIPDTKVLKFTCSGSVSPYACTVVINDSQGHTSTISIKVATFTVDFKGR
jgi:prepilin-type N-terminal cleavage/methylation domain-containing protein